MSRRSVLTGPAVDRPLYARVLRLRHVHPGSVQCFALFESTIMLGALLALAELVPWWGVLALPASVAAMVKINDMVAGTTGRGVSARASRGWFTAVGARAVAGAVSADAAGAGRVYGSPAGGPLATRLFRALVRGGAAAVVARASVPAKGATDRGAAGGQPRRGDESTTLGLAHSLNVLSVNEAVDSPRQRARQSAARRYQ